MPSELSDLLERGAERPSAEPDFANLVRRGRRRRHTQQATTAMAVIAVLAVTAGVVIPRLRAPDVVFDSGPRTGVGTWEAVPASPLGARENATAVADGDRVVVYGGTEWVEEGDPAGTVRRFDGAVYDLTAGTWTTFPAPPLQFSDSNGVTDVRLLDDGRLLVVDDRFAAAFYSFDAQRWETTAPAPLSYRGEAALEWTGDRLLVWGGWSEEGDRGDGAVWHADTGWTAMSRSPLAARSGMARTWTGERLLIWGGAAGDVDRGEQRVLDDGAAYDPVTDTWTALPQSPLAGRQEPVSSWRGDEWILAGGFGPISFDQSPVETTIEEPSEHCEGNTCSAQAGASVELELGTTGGEEFYDGARYDPEADAWITITPAPAGLRRHGIVMVADRIVAGTESKEAVYEPESDAWRVISRPGVNPMWDTYVAGGRTVILNSGVNLGMNDTDRPRRLGGVVFDSAAKRWDNLAEAETAQRHSPAVVAVGSRLFVWGGTSVTRDISQGYSGEDGDPWHRHADGAVLTLD